MKAWLEPLPDGSLPSLDIQREMFRMLDKVGENKNNNNKFWNINT